MKKILFFTMIAGCSFMSSTPSVRTGVMDTAWAIGVGGFCGYAVGADQDAWKNDDGTYTDVTTQTLIKVISCSIAGLAVASATYGYSEHKDDDGSWDRAIAATAAMYSSPPPVIPENDQDRCEPYDLVTAICVDGWQSCSQHRRGTCSHHLGVADWTVYGTIIPE